MQKRRGRIFLYIGILLLCAALLLRWLCAPMWLFWVLFVAAIALKVSFLITIFRTKGFRMTMGLRLILLGVALILISLLLKSYTELYVLQRILFFVAIVLKVLGVVLLVSGGGKRAGYRSTAE